MQLGERYQYFIFILVFSYQAPVGRAALLSDPKNVRITVKERKV